MKNIRNRIFAAGLVVLMFVLLLMGMSVMADAKVSLNKSKVTVGVGKTKIIKVKNAGKKVSWKVLSGKKNISITKGKDSVKVKGKKEGKAKLQIKTRGKKLMCRITVKKKSNTEVASRSKITVKSSKYTIVYQLNDSPAAKDLYNQLPLTVEVENYSDNEKIFYPPKELKTNNTPKSGGKRGTIAYYAPWGDVVMFYETAGSASGLYELGTVVSGDEDISKLSGRIMIDKAD